MASSLAAAGTVNASPRTRASSTMAVARMCGESWSADAASPRTRSTVQPGATAMSVPRGRPEVSVPVLSSTRVLARPRVSSAPPPRTRTPIRDVRDRPDTIATGAASSSGQGVATTRTATARSAVRLSSQARPATASATGTNQAAMRSARRTTGAVSAAAWRASATMPA